MGGLLEAQTDVGLALGPVNTQVGFVEGRHGREGMGSPSRASQRCSETAYQRFLPSDPLQIQMTL